MTMAIFHTRKFLQGGNDYGTRIQESSGNPSEINLCRYKYMCMYKYKYEYLRGLHFSFISFQTTYYW